MEDDKKDNNLGQTTVLSSLIDIVWMNAGVCTAQASHISPSIYILSVRGQSMVCHIHGMLFVYSWHWHKMKHFLNHLNNVLITVDRNGWVLLQRESYFSILKNAKHRQVTGDLFLGRVNICARSQCNFYGKLNKK